LDIGHNTMSKDGQYLYAIVATNEEKSFGPIGIGDEGNEVYTVCYRDIGAVISLSPVSSIPLAGSTPWPIRRLWKR